MAEDAEKRFQSVMDKIFHASKSNLSLPSSSPIVQNARGQKRPHSAMEPNARGDKSEGGQNAAQASPCRPWDRGDLMRRLATFKSMTWFAKPKIVDAVSCARRGWVNVDMDIIACELCGARLQFSTPSSWSQEQVEKAALVFSLKLDSGHKLLCPWIDNACDEMLSLFPPTPAPLLVGRYRERSSALMRLSALPVISALALKNMRSPRLAPFLDQCTLVERGERPNSSSLTESLGKGCEEASADLYYQAHRLLSLCGWEPRLLPYMVDCSNQPKDSTTDVGLPALSKLAAGEQHGRLNVYYSGSEAEKENEFPLPFDPNSTVLECKLCGANVGLWAFKTVRRPLEFIRMVGYTDINSSDGLRNDDYEMQKHGNNGVPDLTRASKEAVTPLSLTIAGGPPPTKQNFRAMISLPVIGRNLRTRFLFESLESRSTSVEDQTSHCSIAEAPVDSTQNKQGIPSDSNNLPPAVEDSGTLSRAACDSNAQISGRSDTGPCESIRSATNDLDKSVSSSRVADDNYCLHQKPINNDSGLPIGGEYVNGADSATQSSLKKDLLSGLSEDLKRPRLDKKMEFDPIRQHRHFCPWVASSGATAAGWQQTLAALQKEKVFSPPDSKGSPASPSLIKVDDPITSIRWLFKSPSAKRMKPTSG